MEDDPHSPDDESLDVASRSWKRVVDAAKKTGYREGAHDGLDAVLQKGFNSGFETGFNTTFTLGRFKGISDALTAGMEHPEDITSILDKTKLGSCWICSVEFERQISDTNKDFSLAEVLNQQSSHAYSVKSKLREYFRPIFKKSGIDVDHNP